MFMSQVHCPALMSASSPMATIRGSSSSSFYSSYNYAVVGVILIQQCRSVSVEVGLSAEFVFGSVK